jgi:tRNA-modifying protein YgfZ
MSHREQETCHTTFLPDRGVLRVSGADAKTFLQGLLSNDLEKTTDGNAIFAGLLSPQGKILFDFFIVPDQDSFLIEAPAESVEALAKRISFYKLRSNVTVEVEPTLAVAAAWGGTPVLPDDAIAHADPRLPDLGLRILLPKSSALDDTACAPASEADYHAHRIALGVPLGGLDYAYGEAFPHEALYDQLAGVDFKKGCYVGQEVVSRMQHRGTARKRVVQIEGDHALEQGSDVTAGALPVGTIGSVDGTRGLALLRLDRVASALAKGDPLQAGSATVTVRLPAFATFELPVAEGV